MRLSAKLIGTSVEADILRELRNRLVQRGYDSGFLQTRLEFQEVQQALTQYLPHFAACQKCDQFQEQHKLGDKRYHTFEPYTRVHPNFLPTQADGRWSVTKPPMITITKEHRDELVIPDPDTAWICWDWDALHARFAAAYSSDYEDLEAFEKGYDIHTITACRMVGLSLPPNLANPHTSPECEEWRVKNKWKGKEDDRRNLAKVRYCLIFGKNETAVEGSAYEKEMVRLGYDRNILKKAGRAFLKAKPKLVACKRKWWEECARTGMSRTLLGRRRPLFGDYWSKAKEGWAHMLQGLEADLLNMSLIEIMALSPAYRLAYPAHDAAKIVVPLSYLEPEYLKERQITTFKRIVERDLIIEGNKIKCKATWYIRYPDGSKEYV